VLPHHRTDDRQCFGAAPLGPFHGIRFPWNGRDFGNVGQSALRLDQRIAQCGRRGCCGLCCGCAGRWLQPPAPRPWRGVREYSARRSSHCRCRGRPWSQRSASRRLWRGMRMAEDQSLNRVQWDGPDGLRRAVRVRARRRRPHC
jgi:hypothetical protein